jgi:hypothetical protein
MSELVEKLSAGDHAVEISLRPQRTAQALKKCINKGYVHVKFTETRGGTDLYVVLDSERSDLAGFDFSSAAGKGRLVGNLVLDYVPVRCVADIDLATLAGKGHLEKVAEERPAE